MLGKPAALALYRAAADARHAAVLHGAKSTAAVLAHEQLLVTIDSLCDDRGGHSSRRVAPAALRDRRTVTVEGTVHDAGSAGTRRLSSL